MWVYFANNPEGKHTGDCVIRALSKALNQSWEQTYIDLCIEGLAMCDWGNSNPVWDAYIRAKGFMRFAIPMTCPNCYSIADFAREHDKGTFIVATGSHVVCVQDGDIYDSWDSSREIPTYYYQKRSE